MTWISVEQNYYQDPLHILSWNISCDECMSIVSFGAVIILGFSCKKKRCVTNLGFQL